MNHKLETVIMEAWTLRIQRLPASRLLWIILIRFLITILRISKPVLGPWLLLLMLILNWVRWQKQNLLIREAQGAQEFMELPRISINSHRDILTKWNRWALHHGSNFHQSLALSNLHKIFKVHCQVRVGSKSSVTQILSNLTQKDSQPWYLPLTASLELLLFTRTKTKRKTIIKEEPSECKMISNRIVQGTTLRLCSNHILTTINSSSKIKIKRKKKT